MQLNVPPERVAQIAEEAKVSVARAYAEAERESLLINAADERHVDQILADRRMNAGAVLSSTEEKS